MSMLDNMADGNAALLGGVTLGRQLGEDLAGYIIDRHYARLEARDAEQQAREEERHIQELIADRDFHLARRISNATKANALEKMLKARGVDIKGKDREEYIRYMREKIKLAREKDPNWYKQMKRLKEQMPHIMAEKEIAEEVY